VQKGQLEAHNRTLNTFVPCNLQATTQAAAKTKMAAVYMKGIVISSGKMNKTVKVATYTKYWQQTYNIQRLKTSKFMVHDEHNMCNIGDQVLVRKSRPYSRHKHHIVERILVKDKGAQFLQEHPEYFVSNKEKKERKRQEKRLKAVNRQEASVQDTSSKMDFNQLNELARQAGLNVDVNTSSKSSTSSSPAAKQQTLNDLD
jgi:small subunit ribosomal protein S17